MKKLILLFLLVVLLILSGCSGVTTKEYDDLYDKYLDLESYYEETHNRYDEMNSWYDSYADAIMKSQDPLVVLSCYFDADEWPDKDKATYDEAYNAYEELCSLFYPFY